MNSKCKGEMAYKSVSFTNKSFPFVEILPKLLTLKKNIIGMISAYDLLRKYDCSFQKSIQSIRGISMFNWALIFLVVAIIAGVLGMSGIAGTATNIAWLLFVVGLIMAIIFAITGRRPRL